MAERPSLGAMRVIVAYSPQPRVVIEVPLELEIGATIADALRTAGLESLWNAASGPGGAGLAVWGQRARIHQILHDQDRVEICRPLIVDPKTARRERFQRQGARGTGLFARRRPGSKPGY